MITQEQINHTPGPWKIAHGINSDNIGIIPAWSNCMTVPICLISSADKYDKQDEANAGLIVKAPEMAIKIECLTEELALYKDFYYKFADSIQKYWFDYPAAATKEEKLKACEESIDALKASQAATKAIAEFNKRKTTQP